VSDAQFLLAAAAAAVVLTAAALLLRSGRRGGPMLSRPGTRPGARGPLDAGAGRHDYLAAGREALALLEAGRRDEAVELVRGRTGLGSAEAEAAVVRLEKLMKRLG
jgi:hypothetical protein